MAIDYAWLESTVLKRKLKEGERSELGRLLIEKSVAKKTNILTQGQVGGVLYILRSGMAEITADSNGQQVHLGGAREGDLFGELTFLTGDVATATVVAENDCIVYKLKRDDCSKLMQSEPDLVYAFVAYMLANATKIIRSKDADHVNMMQFIGSSHK
ncbi:MAG: cyclic nucleotide-binding domain-containing protein [Mariprofundus sp.]|nr:cyclic nucleotide-binding domain-containing protein [Mariprofundus sp.]